MNGKSFTMSFNIEDYYMMPSMMDDETDDGTDGWTD
jgi:hypothetical protein